MLCRHYAKLRTLAAIFMKRTILIIITSFTVFACTNVQTKQTTYKKVSADTTKTMSNFEYSLKTAHPNAKTLMAEDFYWSPIEETGPFGSDDGWEAAQGFREWRLANKSESPIAYLKDLIARWQYPYFNWNEMDAEKIKAYIGTKANPDEASLQLQMQQMREAFKNHPDTSMKNIDDAQLRQVILSSSQQVGGIFLLGQDNAIIGTGFAQLALEGKIDHDLKSLTITAIKRQLLPVLINRYDSDYRDKRREQLTKMLSVMTQAGS
jgi:uncharacterized protein YfeS